MLKQIPNLITLCNLICGCIAISFIMTANPHLITTNGGEDYFPIWGSPKLIYGSYFILLAALFDVFDGMAARALKVESSLGKDLDSLADIVSFGVAPAMIIYQLIWMSVMKEPKAMDVPSFYQFFAFLLPCAGAYRLARFNQNNKAQAQYFQGMPIPATGILVALLPFSLFSEPVLLQSVRDAIAAGLEQKWVLMAITVLLSYLMVSTGPFLKWKAPNPGITGWWAHILIVVAAVLGFIVLGWSGLLIAFCVYIIVSKLYRYPAVQA